MAPRGNVRVKIETRVDDRGIRKADRDISRLAQSGTKSFNKLKTSAIAAGVAGAGALALIGKASIEQASDINEAVTKNQQLFGRYAVSVDRFARGAADSWGLSRKAALDATGVFGAMFATLDLGQKKSSDMSLRLTRLAADLASFHNTDISQVFDDLRSGLSGEVEPLRKYGILLSDAALRQEALRLGLVKTTKEALTPQQKAMAAYNLSIKQAGKANGDFQRTSQGLANQQRVLHAEVENLEGQLGKELLPTTLKVVKAVNKFIGEMKSGTGAGGRFKDKMVEIGQELKPVAGALKTIGNYLKDHPRLLRDAAIAWGVYKTAALAAMVATRTKMIKTAFTGTAVSAAASAGGVAAGTTFASKFSKAAKGIGWAAVGATIALEIEKGIGGAFEDGPGLPGDPSKKSNSPWNQLKDLITKGKLPDAWGGFTDAPQNQSGPIWKPQQTNGTSIAQAQELAKKFGVRFSGFRSKEHNAEVGGAPNSLHTRGSLRNPGAIDFTGTKAQLDKLFAYIKKNIPYAELLWQTKGHFDHLHLGFPGFGKPQIGGPGTGGSSKGARPKGGRWDLGNAESIIGAAADRYGVPKELLWGIFGTESGFGSNLGPSSAGALGPFQFMPGTAKMYGVKNPNSLTQSATGAAKYIRDLLKRFDGDVQKALNAYSGGGGKGYYDKVMANSRKKGGSGPPGLSDVLDLIKEENEAKRALPRAIVELGIAQALTTSTKNDDIQAYTAMARLIRKRMSKITAALKGPLSNKKRLELTNELSGLNSELTDTQSALTDIGTARANKGSGINAMIAGVTADSPFFNRMRAGFDSTAEDLTTNAGRGMRIMEIGALRQRPVAQLAVLTAAQGKIKARISRMRSAIKRLQAAGKRNPALKPLHAGTIKAYQAEIRSLKAQLVELGGTIETVKEDIAGFDAEIKDVQKQAPTQMDFFRAQLGMAQLTPDTGDDLKWLGSMRTDTNDRLQKAFQAGDWFQVIELSGDLKSLDDQIKDLTDATKDNTEAMQAQIDLLKQQAEDANRRAAVAASQTTAFGRALLDMFNGQVGGVVGLSRQTPSVAGSVARY